MKNAVKRSRKGNRFRDKYSKEVYSVRYLHELNATKSLAIVNALVKMQCLLHEKNTLKRFRILVTNTSKRFIAPAPGDKFFYRIFFISGMSSAATSREIEMDEE